MPRSIAIQSDDAAVLVGEGGGNAFDPSDTTIQPYKLVQNFSYSVGMPREEPKQLGTQDVSFRQLNRQPDIELNFSYIPEPSLANESFGLFSQNAWINYKQMFGGVSNYSTNFYVVLPPENATYEPYDVITGGSDVFNLTGFDCLAFGNCYTNSYSLSYSIGGLPLVTTSYIASNMVYESLTGTSMEMPAINLTGGNNDNVKRCIFEIDPQMSNDITPPIVNPTDPNSSITLQNLQVGGQNLSGVHLVQSVDMQVNLSRVSSYGLGNNFPYNRKAQFPADGSFSVSSLVSGFDDGFLTGVLDNDENYSFECVIASGNKKLIYEVQDAKLASYNYTMGINDVMNFSADFSFKVTEERGLRLSGTSY